MANPQAGWYPDPAGNPTMIRYWDGTQWTDQYREVDPSVTSSAAEQQAAASQPAGQTSYQQQPQQQPQQQAYQAASDQQTAYNPNQAGAASAQGTQNAYDSQYGNSGYVPPAQNYDPSAAQSVQQPYYPMTQTDNTLRLIGFILNIISCVAVCYLIIPLAWMIPMTVISYKIYKGTKPNTVAFGVCTLLFLNIISGILLLCSTKND